MRLVKQRLARGNSSKKLQLADSAKKKHVRNVKLKLPLRDNVRKKPVSNARLKRLHADNVKRKSVNVNVCFVS